MSNPLIQPDPGIFVWTILTFLVLLAALAKFAWRPLLNALEKREQRIRDSLAQAEKARQELERVQEESRKIIAEARAQAQSIIEAGRGQGEKAREEILESARSRADSIVSAAEKEIEAEKERALAQIRAEVADLSIAVASKLIGRNISPEDNRTLIENSLRQIDTHKGV